MRHRWPPDDAPADRQNACIVCGVKRRFLPQPDDKRFKGPPMLGEPRVPMIVEYLVPGVGWSVQRPECEIPGQLQLLDPDPRGGILP